ncbi:MAG: GntR family transcriptional regulator [Clostridiales bacterium]|nr:GntR family transcriptional regulator [Clostridiales bacterium]
MKAYLPYYVQIKSQLSKEIASMQPHQRIPSEHELMGQYNVSRGTVKQAVQDLVYEGLLYREQGKGTFVAPARINRSFEHLPTFTNDVLAQGFKPVYRVLFFGTVYAGSPIAEKLRVIPGAGVIRYKRVMNVDNEPLAVICSYLRSDVFPDFQMSDIGESLYESLLKKYNTMPTMAIDTYSIVKATVKTADLLGIRKGDPLFFSERVGQHPDGSPVEYVESFIRGDKYKLTICVGNNCAPNPRQITHHFEP